MCFPSAWSKVESDVRDLSIGMQRLNGRYAQRFNQRYDRVGHVFQNRFGSYVIETNVTSPGICFYFNAAHGTQLERAIVDAIETAHARRTR